MDNTNYQPNAMQMATNRSMLKTILLNLITCGIYGIIFYYSLAENINLIASRRDGRKTMNYLIMALLLTPITCGIAPLVWMNNLSDRIGNEARARGVQTSFGAGTFWLWNILGSLIIIGPFIYLHQLCETMNAICADYNQKGI